MHNKDCKSLHKVKIWRKTKVEKQINFPNLFALNHAIVFLIFLTLKHNTYVCLSVGDKWSNQKQQIIFLAIITFWLKKKIKSKMYDFVGYLFHT